MALTDDQVWRVVREHAPTPREVLNLLPSGVDWTSMPKGETVVSGRQ